MEIVLAALAASIVARARPDVAYVRLSASSSAVPAMLAALRVPVVLELNGRILDELRDAGRPPLVIAAARASLRAVVAVARHLVVVEAAIGRHAEAELGARRLSLIENGVDLGVATPGDRGAARRRLGLDPATRIVTFAGTLVPQQRVDLLLEAHKALAGITLLVAGAGPLAERVAGAARVAPPASPIIVLGAVPHEVAVAAIRAADACVNVRDGDLGMKGFEYAAAGRRFAAFCVEGAERLHTLYPGLEAVHLIQERTADGVVRGMRAALDAEARLGPIPPQAVERARATIGWEHTARRIAAVLDACA